MSRREKYQIYNTLAAIPMILIGKGVLIDLRNETSIAGRIVNIDGYMNINLEEVVFIDQKGLQYEFDEFLAPTRTIRQIHIPESLDLTEELRNYFNKLSEKKSFKRKPLKQQTFKVKKSYKRHQEILESIYKNKEK